MLDRGLTIHTDGGSRGNPGPAACAFVVEKNDTEIFCKSKFLGTATNNFAEYSGVITALDWLIENNTYSMVNFYLDSELVVRQINGLYKVKDENLKKLFLEVLTKIKETKVRIIFKHVPREENSRADFLVNQELDTVKVSRL